MRLKRSVRVCCPRTPLLGGKLCSEHGESALTTDETCDYVVINHEKIKPFGPEPEQFRVLLRESGGTNREFWAEENMVHPALLARYFTEVGMDRIAALASTRFESSSRRRK